MLASKNHASLQTFLRMLTDDLDQEHQQADPMDGLTLRDIEKSAVDSSTEPQSSAASQDAYGTRTGPTKRYFKSIERTLFKYNIEARGIQRVLPEHRHDTAKHGFMQVFMVWTSINLEAIMVTLGMLGPVVYSLPFLDSCLLSVFGALVGTLPVAYIATFGPRSGNRTMILTRFVTGWWPTKLIVILTLIIFMGYTLIDAVIGGQILSAVSSNDSLNIIVGIVIVCAITWLVTTFGYAVFHIYERYAWIPQLIVLCLLAGVAGPKFDLYYNPAAEQGFTTRELIGNRLSFFSLCLASQITYAQAGADFFVYYPEKTSPTKMFLATALGLTISSAFTLIIGIGLGSGTFTNTDWNDAYGVSQGALIVEAFRPLGGFGSFCSVIVALSLVGNMIPPCYAAGIDFQALGCLFEKIPRIFWNTVAIVVPLVCAIAGRENLAEIFTNFLALMGYWVSIWIAIVLEEHFIFRRYLGRGWEWSEWNDRTKLPLGIAALFAFLVGWAGAILCMAQVWYVGPLAGLISAYGGDMGNYVGFTWAGLVYPLARWLEIRRFGR